MTEIPFVAFGNNELINKQNAGKFAICPNCHKKHKIKYGTNVETKEICKDLGFVKCGKESYLVSVKNKLI